MSKVSNKILTRVYILFGAVTLFACAIFFRVVKISYFEKDRWLAEVQEDRVYYKKVAAARGNILSADGEILATTQPEYRLAIDPSLIHKEDFESFDDSLRLLCKNVAGMFGTVSKGYAEYMDEINRAIERGDRHYYFSWKTVDHQDYKKAKTWPILNRSKMKGGLIVERYNNTRNYPFRNLARITLGVLEGDSVARKGLEYSFDEKLRGEDGQVLVQRLPGGHEIPMEGYGKDESEDGADIVTTLNLEFQDIVESALSDSVEKNSADWGVAILMEVETGYIRAIANYPENQNRGVAMRMDPGSTFKLASVMALMDDGHVKPTDSIDTGHNGVRSFYKEEMTDHAALGKLSLVDVFAHSSNIGVATLVNDFYGRRPERFIEKLENFGLLDQVMTQLVGEPEPDVISPEDEGRWDGTTLPWMSIGYNSQITPLQILTFYNGVANNGKVMQPLLVKEIRKNSKVIKSYEPTVINRKLASSKTLGWAKEMLVAVVEKGTARNIRTSKYQIAGKTGTAKILGDDGEYKQRYRASFCGFFPAEKPKYSLYVLVDEPKKDGKYYGGSVAAPIFKSIADQIYAIDLDLSRDRKVNEQESGPRPVTAVMDQETAERVYQRLNIHTPSQPETRWVKANQEGGKVKFSPMELEEGIVPNVSGMSAKDAVALLGSLGLQVRLRGNGKVSSQSIDAGSKLHPRSVISLTLE